jgi:hypothetical protein
MLFAELMMMPSSITLLLVVMPWTFAENGQRTVASRLPMPTVTQRVIGNPQILVFRMTVPQQE